MMRWLVVKVTASSLWSIGLFKGSIPIHQLQICLFLPLALALALLILLLLVLILKQI